MVPISDGQLISTCGISFEGISERFADELDQLNCSLEPSAQHRRLRRLVLLINR